MEDSQNDPNSIGIPKLGFGTYQLSTNQAEQSVHEALEAGFRHIDSAEGYDNEEGTGRAIAASIVSRNELFVTTKLFPGFPAWGIEEKDYSQTIDTLKRQLKQLQLDYVDLYLIHAPMAARRLEQWRALVELKRMGLTKHIGVSNYDQLQLEEIAQAGMPMPEANQIEFHPLCTRQVLSRWMRNKGIAPIAYSCLAPLASWRSAEGQGGEVPAEQKTSAQGVIRDIARDVSRSEAQVLLRWAMQHGYAVLTRSSKPSHIRDSFGVLSFELPQSAMKRLDALNRDQAFAWAANGIDPMSSAPKLATEAKEG